MKEIVSACSFPLLAANFVIESYVSDDGFRSFRAWLVSQGRNRFRGAVNDPESISEWLDKSSVDEIDGEPMLAVARDAYIEAGGNEQEFFQRTGSWSDPEMIHEWPESKDEFRKRFPKLVDCYWNDVRIREMHAD